jgi:hypothetical protein
VFSKQLQIFKKQFAYKLAAEAIPIGAMLRRVPMIHRNQ